MARNTFTAKSVSTVFVVRNIVSSHKTIRIFGQRIGWNRSYDLLTIPDISESDIRHSLLKGELKRKADVGEIRVTSSTIDLTQFDSEQKSFLQSLGISSGIASAPDVVANISELSALDESLFSGGIAIPVQTLFDWFTLIKTSTETADGITIVETSSGTGRWQRACIPNDQWRRQLTWFMDSVNGDDENVGDTDDNPIQTFEEFRRRHGKHLTDHTQVPATKTFTILDTGDVTQNFIIDMRMRNYPENFIINGTVGDTIYSGSVTGYLAWNVGTQQEPQLTDAAIPVSWTASEFVHKQMIMTSGAQTGATAYVSSDSGSKTVLMPKFLAVDGFSIVEPTIADTFDIVNKTTIKGNVQIDVGEGVLQLFNIEMDNGAVAYRDDLTVRSGNVTLHRCATVGTNNNQFGLRPSANLNMRGGMVGNNGDCYVRDALFQPLGTLFSGINDFKLESGCRFWTYTDCTFDACGSLNMWVGSDVSFEGDTLFVNCGAVAPVTIKPGAILQALKILWGTIGNTPAYAFKLGNMATIAADIENLKIMGSTTNDILLGSIGVDYDETRPMEDGYSGAKVFDSYP